MITFKKPQAAFSLIELSIAMAIIAILASSVVPIAIRSFQIKAAEKTALEMKMIQEASRNYYSVHHAWPATIEILKTEGYLNPNWIPLNPWHTNPYQISNNNLALIVETDVPMEWTSLVASHLTGTVITNTKVASTITSVGSNEITSGVIVAWSGSIANIPQGWTLCDGNNGTPDLRDRFIVGAKEDSNNIAKTNITGSLLSSGGNVSHHHGGLTGAHQLSVAEMPRHQHASWGESGIGDAPWGVAPYGGGHIGGSNSDWDNQFYQTEPQGGNQAHSHTISSDNHVPPFYALAFIMKL